MDEHKLPLKELFKQLSTSPEGLSSAEAAKRLARKGPNVLETKKDVPLILRFLKQFTNFFAVLLMIGSGLAFFAEYLSPGDGNLYIGVALAAVVLLNSAFTFIQEYESERIMESFRKMLPSMVETLRDGKKKEIRAEELVPGDVIFLSEGDKIPADGRLIRENALKVDNSSLTGESEPQLRKLECTHENILESRNMVFSGTLVQSGNGEAVVFGTGMHTEIGKILKLTKETRQVDSPLHKELRYFIKIISSIAIFLGILFFLISVAMGQQLMGSLIFAIGIIVANVPEGLLPTVTLSLSIAAKKMAKNNALIKNLESVETLGSTTVICTDKTGTITQNKMSVNTIFIDNESVKVFERELDHTKTMPLLLRTMVLCNNAHMQEGTFHGDPTETSLLEFASKLIDIDEVSAKEPRVHESPFDSKTKRMITTNAQKKGNIAFMKGAPEVVIKKCDRIMVKGVELPLTPDDHKRINSEYEHLASRGERVLAFAFKPTIRGKSIEKGFTFIGLAGMLDPPRPEIADAIATCRRAGIRVIMITGDYSLTAEAIARKVGMVGLKEKATIVTGEELAEMGDYHLKEILKKDPIIFARTNPIQKLRIVQGLQSLGEVVTVTGDGVNDAPAIKNADMGVAMGLGGTDVAKEASDMVLLDDNFATIVKAVESGRTIFENIKKFIAYILTSNVPEILPFIAFVLLNSPLAITVVLILAIDLGTDLLPALGLGNEKPEVDVMSKPPRSRKERLLTGKLLFISYGIVGMLQAAAGFFSFFFILTRGGWSWGQELAFSDPLYMRATTAFFASVVICQVADVMICRTRKQSVFDAGLFSNRMVLLGIFVELGLVAIISYVPAANTFFGTAPLSLLDISLSLPFAFLIFFGDVIRKILYRRGNRFIEKYLTW